MKVTIAGTRHVGSALTYVCVLEGLADQLVLVNRDRRTADEHALDLQHTASLVRHPVQVRSGDVLAAANSDVIVMTMSVPMARGNPDRRALAMGNAAVIRDWMPPLAKGSPEADL